MNRLVNIFMIIIIVSCPLRCMMQGCGCFVEMPTCCSSLMASCPSGGESHDVGDEECCCDRNETKPVPTVPAPPQKCQCNCFCSGVILADDFVLNEDHSSAALFDALETAIVDARFQQSLVNRVEFYPPDNLADELAINRGRQIRCQINSFVI